MANTIVRRKLRRTGVCGAPRTLWSIVPARTRICSAHRHAARRRGCEVRGDGRGGGGKVQKASARVSLPANRTVDRISRQDHHRRRGRRRDAAIGTSSDYGTHHTGQRSSPPTRRRRRNSFNEVDSETCCTMLRRVAMRRVSASAAKIGIATGSCTPRSVGVEQLTSVKYSRRGTATDQA